MLKKILFLTIAIVISIIAVFIQQFLDNDQHYHTTIKINNNKYYLDLPKVNEGVIDCIIEVKIPDHEVEGYVYYKLLNSKGKWERIKMLRLGDKLVSIIPYQKANIKIQYYFEFFKEGKIYTFHKEEPFVVLFRNEVPKVLTYLYAILLFVSLIISNYLGILTIFNIPIFFKYIHFLFYILTITILINLISHLWAYRHIFVTLSPNADLRFYKYLIIYALWFIVFKWFDKYEGNRIKILIISVLTLFLFCVPDHYIFKFLF